MSDEQPYLISFSQASKYQQCKRSWAYKYVDGLQEPTSIFMYMGSKMHKKIEKAFTEPQDSYDPVTINALNFIQDFNPAKVKVEEHLLSELDKGVQVQGYADIIIEKTDGYTYTFDWKSKNRRPESPSDENILQVNLYGALAGTDSVGVFYPQYELSWIWKPSLEDKEVAYDFVFGAGREIVDSGALEIPGALQQATKNKFCYFCSFKEQCREDGGVGSY